MEQQPSNKRKKSHAMLKVITPKTPNQKKIFEAFDNDMNLFIHGPAGTGKTFVAMFLALDAVEHRDFQRLIIIRSTVPSRNQGFLPGNEGEKNAIFEAPYEAMVPKLYNHSTPNSGPKYRDLKNLGKIEFLSTSYLRGLTFEDSVILVDEVQDMNDMEINTIITRTGDNCQLIICGDKEQNDLLHLREESCISVLPEIISNMRSFCTIEMSTKDNQRNNVVAEWVEARKGIDLTSTMPRWIRDRK